jgi:alkylation response protein AidB-like acyl-CoA dehydrogenase
MAHENVDVVWERMLALAERLRGERAERTRRTALDPEDFRALAAAGWLLTGLPDDAGGWWRGVQQSTRDYCTCLRALARGDPSLALVASMHPAVLVFWLAVDRVDDTDAAWQAQRRFVFETVRAGHWWGTVISEPGSGGDPARTRARARPEVGGYRISGEKHFGSGSGVTSFMITTALAEGESAPDLFYIDMRERAWDGSSGLTLRRAWDGFGMMATQSHAFELDDCPAVRCASPQAFPRAAAIVAQFTPLLFAAVILGVIDEAVAAARTAVAPRRQQLRAYEQVGWTQAMNQVWLAEQAYEGALRAVEAGSEGPLAAARAKLTIAELAESALTLLSRVVGGGTFSKGQPFGQWAQDVRALGFLRPPWGYAYDQLLALDGVGYASD